MPFNMSFGESLYALAMVALGLLPLIVLGWALLTLARIRSAQREMLERLDALERRGALQGD